jgi:predicted transcriptional regulator
VEDAAQRFIAAFNDIESRMRAALNRDEYVEFGKLARDYVAAFHLPREHREQLAMFARLRNAISHEPYRDGHAIAEPRKDVVEQIEQLRNLYLTPPTALSVLGEMVVCSVSPSQPVSVALEYIRRFDYSQLPVYNGGNYVGLLTTNAIARWLAAQLAASGGLAEAEAVSRVLDFTEQHEGVQHVPRSITAADAIHQLSKGGAAGKPLTALIITHSGKQTEKPLALVVDDDLPALIATLTIN